MRSLVVFLLVAVALSGCASNTNSDPEPEPEPEPMAPRPGEMVAPTMMAPVRLGIASFGGEPNIEVGPDGTIFIASPIHMWRSTDGGATYEAVGTPECAFALGLGPDDVCPPGYEGSNPGMDGGGDGAIIADAGGRLYWAGLFGSAGTVPFQYSDDGGDTWSSPIDAAFDQGGDREWLDVTPDGRVFVNWRNGGSSDEAGVWVTRGLDRGETWDEQPIRVTDDHIGGPIVHDVVTENLYIPLSGFDAKLDIAKSVNGGLNWTVHSVHEITGDSVEGFRLLATSIFPVLDVDAAGNIHMVWAMAKDPTLPKQAESPGVFYTKSTDEGETWSEPLLISNSGVSSLFPWVVAGAEGRIAVGWYQNLLGAPSEATPDVWNVMLAQSINALEDSPSWMVSQVNEDPIHAGSVCTSGTGCLLTAGDRSLLDFFEIDLDINGYPVVAYAADAPSPYFDAVIWAGGVADGTPLR